MRSLALALRMVACTPTAVKEDPWADAGPDFAGHGLTTHLHRGEDGAVVAELTAKRFWGFQQAGRQVLEGVVVRFHEAGLRLSARRAALLEGGKVELRGDVQGEMGLRRFRTQTLLYDGGARRFTMSGPTDFFGDRHQLRAAGGAEADERFDELKLLGPVEGEARVGAR